MPTTHETLLAGLAALMMVGCTSKSDMGLTDLSEDTASDDWWTDAGGDDGSSEGGADDGEGDDEGEDDEDEDEDDEDEGDGDEDEDEDEGDGDEAYIWGELEGTGAAREGWGGVEVWSGGRATCVLEFDLTETGSLSDCSACTSAFTVTIGEVEVEESSGCAAEGYDPATLPGTELAVGISGDAAYTQVEGARVESGESWTEEDMLVWELWLDE